MFSLGWCICIFVAGNTCFSYKYGVYAALIQKGIFPTNASQIILCPAISLGIFSSLWLTVMDFLPSLLRMLCGTERSVNIQIRLYH